MTRLFSSLTVVCALALASCGDNDKPEINASPEPALQAASAVTDNALTADQAAALPKDTLLDDGRMAPVLGATEIPYPVYPNGTKYRVGGENGLKIVVFETNDSFEAVDDYYSQHSDDTGMSRLMAMSDYVRYAQNQQDIDPWATFRPGIVIHNFTDDQERQAVGASANAKTNIIMSF